MDPSNQAGIDGEFYFTNKENNHHVFMGIGNQQALIEGKQQPSALAGREILKLDSSIIMNMFRFWKNSLASYSRRRIYYFINAMYMCCRVYMCL